MFRRSQNDIMWSTGFFCIFSFAMYFLINLLVPDFNFKMNENDIGVLAHCNITQIDFNDNLILWRVTPSFDEVTPCSNRTDVIIYTKPDFIINYVYNVGEVRDCYYSKDCTFAWIEEKIYKIVGIILLVLWILSFMFLLCFCFCPSDPYY